MYAIIDEKGVQNIVYNDTDRLYMVLGDTVFENNYDKDSKNLKNIGLYNQKIKEIRAKKYKKLIILN